MTANRKTIVRSNSIKSITIVALFRGSSWIAQSPHRFLRLVGLPLRLGYKLLVEIIMGVELPDRVKAGRGLVVYHGVGLVVHQDVLLGEFVTLRQNTTIGERYSGSGVPKIGDRVDIGANCVILGPIHIGDGAKIGAGAIVVEDCPAGSVWVSAKAKMKVQ